ncbi:uncharacterized protein LOC124815820 [Hydra vulgaris]|uniref:uncharacterized protein LOC124815820 n=1 Tax=Hydra vulgaris TaxID=6087 RepID=UPI001F5F80A4|nr:uncharacterized protein LOC124815820 [Hydra vulgaris]
MKHNDRRLLKRKCTFIAFSLQLFVIGMEYSMTFLTLWSYINEMINTNTPKIYYSAVSVSYMLASIIATPFVGRIVDKSRNVKACFLTNNLLMFIGNFLYCLHFSPYFLIGGRIIAGFGGSLKSVVYSETIRIYSASETSSKLSILSVMYNLGFTIGPVFNLFFKNINFFIGGLQLRYVNFPGFFLGFLCLFMEIITVTMVHNVSKEFDSKDEKAFLYCLIENEQTLNEFHEKLPKFTVELPMIPENMQLIQNSNISQNNPKPQSKKYTGFHILKVLFVNFNSALLLFSSLFLSFFIVNTDIWLPLLVIEKMNLSMIEMNISFFGASGFCVFILIVFIRKPCSDNNLIILLIIVLFGLSVVSASFIILSHYPDNKVLNFFLCIVYMLSFGGAPIITDVFFVNTLAKMIKPNILTFADSIRSTMDSTGVLLALSCSAFMFDYVDLFGTLYVIIMTFIGCLFIICRKQFICPNQLI